MDNNGHIWIWGSDPAYQFQEATAKFYAKPTQLENLPKITKIACGSWHSLAIDENKNVWGWGKNHFGQLKSEAATSASVKKQMDGIKQIQPAKKEIAKGGMDAIFILKIIKYMLVAFSIVLNIVLYKKLKKTTPALR